MPSRLDDVTAQVQAVNGKKVYVAQQASAVGSASKQLSNVAFRGQNVCGGMGVLLVLQGSSDFRYNLSAGAGTATSDDVKVTAGNQEYVYTESVDTHLNVIRDTADGIVRIYRVV